jgi:hypothetical protein
MTNEDKLLLATVRKNHPALLLQLRNETIPGVKRARPNSREGTPQTNTQYPFNTDSNVLSPTNGPPSGARQSRKKQKTTPTPEN